MTKLTSAQEQALEALAQRIQAGAAAAPAGSPAGPDAPLDWLKTWLGVSSAGLADAAGSLLGRKEALQERLLAWAEDRPMDAVFEFLAGASLAFFAAERGVNPKIHTYMDAFYYISTCASVGYADIFAATQTGRMIASIVMIVGPALTSHALERSK